MKSRVQKQLIAGALAAAMLTVNSLTGFAAAAPDGSTKAETFAAELGISEQYNSWKQEWEEIQNDWTQISLTPGSDESQLNFAWYSKAAKAVTGDNAAPAALKLKIGEGKNMRNAKVYEAVQTEVAGETDQKGNTYLSNKVTAEGLKAGVTYYYCYEKESGSYISPVATTVGNHDADNANYTYHFNTPNNSTLGANEYVGGDYCFTYPT